MKTGSITKRSKEIAIIKEGQKIDVVVGLCNCARKYNIKVQNLWKTLNGYKTTLAGYEFRWNENM